MIKTIPLAKAVGHKLAHDITEIRPGEFKGPAYRRGHALSEADLCHLQRLGKNRLYVLDLAADEIHEDEAAAILTDALSGNGIIWQNKPREGKVNLFAAFAGLLRVEVASLAAFNMVEEVMCATLHNQTLVKEGELVAATRAIPLVMKRTAVEHAASIARRRGSVLEVCPLRSARVGLIITGDEIYHGLIEDRFASILTEKLNSLGSTVKALDFAPDNAVRISRIIRSQLERGCDLLLLSGGMSVDPDDVTRHGIRLASATDVCYGAASLPGAMFLVAYLGEVPLLGVPACALYHRTTVLDLILPRVLTGERIDRRKLALMGHGGLRRHCPECTYPGCSFGKGL